MRIASAAAMLREHGRRPQRAAVVLTASLVIIMALLRPP